MSYFQKVSSNKFHAKKSTYNGMKFDSIGERNYAEELDWRIKAGEIKGYKRQFKIDLTVRGVHICFYYADFLVTGKHDEKEIHEYKGFQTVSFQYKWRLLQALKDELFPEGIELVMIKHKSFYKR